jgi:hypothetical protein
MARVSVMIAAAIKYGSMILNWTGVGLDWTSYQKRQEGDNRASEA